jgi:hypothetical protein
MKKLNSPWGKVKKYADGGQVDVDDPDDDDDEEEKPFVVRKNGNMEKLAKAVTPDDENGAPEEDGVVYDDSAPPTRELASEIAQKPEPTRSLATDPAGAQDSSLNLRQRLEEFMNRRQQGADNMRKLADQYGAAMDKARTRPDHRNFNALQDYYYGTNFSKANEAHNPINEEDAVKGKMAAQQSVDKSEDPIASELLKQYNSDNSLVGKEQANYYRGLSSMNHSGVTHDKALDKMEDDMGKAMNPLSSVYGGGNNNLGTRLARARSINALIAQHPNYDLDPREQKDLALGMASLITNQNRVPYELAQSLTPKTFRGDVAKFAEYVTNNPQSVEAKDFVKRMAQTVAREQNVATQQIGAIQQQQGQRFNRLMLERPQRHAMLLKTGQNYTNMPALDQAADQPIGQFKEIKDPKSGETVRYQKVDNGKWQKVK